GIELWLLQFAISQVLDGFQVGKIRVRGEAVGGRVARPVFALGGDQVIGGELLRADVFNADRNHVQCQRHAGVTHQHAQLAVAEHPEFHASRGSGLASTSSVCCWRNAWMRSARAASWVARIWAASRPALKAPASPMARVPTATPFGICTIDSRLSWPLRARLCTGTPSTGRCVLAATMPGKCAAPPAPAMITL